MLFSLYLVIPGKLFLNISINANLKDPPGHNPHYCIFNNFVSMIPNSNVVPVDCEVSDGGFAVELVSVDAENIDAGSGTSAGISVLAERNAL